MPPKSNRLGQSQKPCASIALLFPAVFLITFVFFRLSLIPNGYSALPTTSTTTSVFSSSNASFSDNEPSKTITSNTIRRYFVVGCGHSGTSLLFRTIGNMRGIRCMERETALFIKHAGKDPSKEMEQWDALARDHKYRAWVEKTPRHVHHIQDMLDADPHGNSNNTRIVFIHRDGRDVVISFRARGYSIEKAVNRWVEDNLAVLPFLESGVAMAVKFEDLTASVGVMPVLRRIAEFLDVEMSDSELGLTLLPGTRERQYQEYCTAYENDDEKFSDLVSSLVSILAGKGSSIYDPTQTEHIDNNNEDLSDRMIAHNSFRTWQMAQAWAEVLPPPQRNWTAEEESYFFGRKDVVGLMEQFGYATKKRDS